MKFQLLKLCFAAAIAFSACTTEVVGPEQEIPEEEQPETPAKRSWQGTGDEVAYQSGGKMLCLGTLSASGEKDKAVITVYRVHTNDTALDLSFDTSTVRKVYGHIFPWNMVVQPDDKILLCGDFIIEGQPYFIIRLTADGALDMEFIKKTGITSRVNNIALSSTGDIYALNGSGNKVVKLRQDGSVAGDFNAFIGTVYAPSSITLLPGGKLLLVCMQDIYRLNADGSFDGTFKFDYTYAKSTNDEYLLLEKAYMQDEKMIVTGRFRQLVNTDDDSKVYNYQNIARFNADGTIDETFEKQAHEFIHLGFHMLSDGTFLSAVTESLFTNNITTKVRRLDKDGKMAAEKEVYGAIYNVMLLPNKKLRLNGFFFNPYTGLDEYYDKTVTDRSPVMEIEL